jgi:FixJ family two-component response regulator
MTYSVYVVDDKQVIADTLAAILNASGYDAKAFYDAESVLSACETDCPTCIISDVAMYAISGIEMAMQITRRYPACKVLLFSGQATTEAIVESAKRNGYEFEVMQKPVHPTELLAKLNLTFHPHCA